MSDYPERISISPVHRQKHDDDFYLVDRKAFPGKGTEYVRADRIEELEAKLAEARLSELAALGQADEAYTAQLELEAELAKPMEARMGRWDELLEPAREALEALFAEGDAMADRIEELEAELAKLAKEDRQ